MSSPGSAYRKRWTTTYLEPITRPGTDSAARYVALSVQQAGRLAHDMQRVDQFVIHQTVGRNSGWLAASSALAKRAEEEAPHLIYMPERPLNRERFVAEAKACIRELGWVSIVCGEGVVWEDGGPVSASVVRDKFANVEFGAMGGTSAALALHQILAKETGLRGEFQIPESLPMCAIDRASELDLKEAYECGRRAVELAEIGETGVMVSIKRESSAPYSKTLQTVPLHEVAIRANPLPPHFIAQNGTFVTPSFVEYAKPLVGELPEHTMLRNAKVKL